MKWKVLISAPYFQPVIKDYRSWFTEHDIEIVVPVVKERLSEDELLALIEDIDGVVCGDDRFTKRVLVSAKKLKVIAKWGTGIDSIDREAAKELGIAVRNTPNAFTDAVADMTLAYILCFARRIPWMDKEMKSGKWEKIPAHSLREATIGVVGVGNIGSAVIRRAKAFGAKLIGNDVREISPEFISETGVEIVSLNDLVTRADYITLHCDLNPTSFHLISEEHFKLMKSTACIINTSRGPVIDEQFLVKALSEGKIFGAGLDVFENEPMPANSQLLKMSQVLLTPHNSNSSPEAWERVHKNTLNNLLEGLNKL